MKRSDFIWLFIITELFLVINEPYAIWWLLPLPNLLLVSALLYLFFLVVMLFWTGKKHSLPLIVNIGFFISITTWFIYFLYYSDSSYITRIALLIITYFFLQCFYRKDDFYRFWCYNNRFILLQAFLSTICMVLVAVGLLAPLLVVNPYGEVFREFYFFGGCFSKQFYGRLIRPSGFLDEPGTLAAWAVYGLMFNYAFVKDKFLDRYLPYFTATTLSVAYFIQMGAYLVLKYIRKVYALIPIAILMLLAISFINSTKGTDFDLYERTLARFMHDDETVIAGNNRELQMENAKRIFLTSPIVGVGAENFTNLQERMSDNPYEILAKDGIVGYIVSYLPLILILFVNKRKEVVISLIVIAMGYLQRPYHIDFMQNLYIWSFLLFAIMDAKESKRVIQYE